MAITQVISDFPDAPSSGEDPSDFNNKANAFVAHQADVYVDEVNTWASQSRTLADELNGIVDGATDSASQAAASATASAQSATESANSASESAYYAQQSANSANFLGEWLVGTTYNQPASVLYGDVTYLLLIPTSTGEQPNLVPDSWYPLDTVANKVSKAGDTMTGHLNVPIGAVGTQAPQMQEVESKINLKLNADGSQRVGGVLDADGYTISGNNLSAFNMRNKLINGGFDVWQRGVNTIINTVSNTYTADRWYTTLNQHTSGDLLVQQNLAQKPIGSKYSLVLDGASNSLVTSSVISLTQIIETDNVENMAGKTITLSFKCKTLSGTHNLTALIMDGTDTDRFPITSTTSSFDDFVVTDTYQTFTLEHIVQDSAKSIAIRFTTESSFNSYLYFANVQLEEGSVATPFEQRPIGMELSLCQRYYWRSFTYPYYYLAPKDLRTPTQSYSTITFPTTMRSTPDVTFGTVYGTPLFYHASTSGATFHTAPEVPTTTGINDITADAEL